MTDMAIILPAHLRNVTSGQLREIAREGYSQSGLFTKEHLENFVRGNRYLSGLTSKNEPIGVFMTTLDQNRIELQESTEAIRQASIQLVDAYKQANDGIVESGRKMRDNTEKVGVALQKFSNIANSANLSKVADDAARLADGLERLAALEKTGQLQRLIAAMSTKA
jgi:hypothetical protein